jgi:NADPH:quinone reductase-like Zn-dependent oxidoreductase
MKAVVVSKYGGPEALEVKEFPAPKPGPGKVLVEVRAAGVNFADVLARLGVYKGAPPRPFIPGIEVAGLVEALGEGVAGLTPGDRVFGFCAFGGYAEKAVLGVDALWKMPADMGFPEAAALPVQYLTAWHGLFNLAHLDAGEALLIHAAAGGVGIACLQLAMEKKAKIFATVGSRDKLAVVLKECPEARVIFYREEDFAPIVRRETGGKGIRVVMDSVGGKTFQRGWHLLAPGGRYVLFGAASAVKPGAISKLGALLRLAPMLAVSPLRMVTANRGLFGFNLLFLQEEVLLLRRSFEGILALRTKGVVAPRISLSLPLEKAAEAQARLQDRSTFGKVILTVNG